MDAFELAVARHADAAGLPILGICRGCQTLNVARGGSLHPAPARPPPDRARLDGHPRRRGRGGLAARAGRRRRHDVASTRSTTRPSSGSATACAPWRGRPTARSRASRATNGRFVLGVQWHAETLDEVERPQARLFGALVEAARASARGGCADVCGFGVELRRDAAPDRAALERMHAALAPRGPDGEGIWLDGTAGMVHRRLAIIDLSELGAQPMRDDALGLAVVFNGCIYNHRELRAELEGLGHASARPPTRRSSCAAGASGARGCWTGSRGCSRSRCSRPAAAAACSCATGSGSSRSTSPSCRAAACAPPRRCRRCWPRAASTRASTRSRCTTT